MYKKAETIKKIRTLMEGGEKYTRACERVVKRETTIQLWRKKYPRVDKYFKKLLDKRDETVVDMVELKLESRILKGEASPAEIIFYLTNRRPNRWADRRHLIGEGFANTTNNIYNIIQQLQRDFIQKDSSPSLALDTGNGLHDGRTRQEPGGEEIPQQGVSADTV